MPLIPGDVIHERYRVDDLLAQGGMSAVYRAWDLRLHVACALKEMVPYPGMDARSLNQLREQFLQEAQVLAELRHPHMPRVTDHFEWDGNAYLIMDFVEGQRLDEIIEEEGHIDVDRLLNWAKELVDALNYCHQQGVLHRDIKPQNVIITPEGTIMLVDFGLAKLLDLKDRHTRTVMRGLGTPEYAPPEQYDAEPGSTDERSDIYSLGATLYHALAGSPPPTATQRIVDPGLLRPVSDFASDIPPQIDKALTRSLSLQPAQRFRTVVEMAEAMFDQPFVKPSSEPLGSGTRPRTDPLGTIMMSHLRGMPRIRLWASAGGLGLAVLVLFIALRSGLAAGAPPVDTPTPSRGIAIATDTLTPTPQPTSTQTPTSTATETPRPTATRTATAGPGVVGTPSGTPTPSHTPTASPTPCAYDAELVEIREPRGGGTWWRPFAAARFDVIMRNNGACAWPEGTRLVLVSENTYGWPEQWRVGFVEVGDTAEIRIQSIQTPGEVGIYPIVLQLESPEGQAIGPEITYNLLVQEPTETPTPTRAVSTPTWTPRPGGPPSPTEPGPTQPGPTPTEVTPESPTPESPTPESPTPEPPTITPRVTPGG